MKTISKVLAVVLMITMVACVMAACGGNSGGSSDMLSGTWKQTDEVNGDWTWTFDGAGKCTLVGITTGIETNGTYTLDETAKTVTVNMELWDDEKVYDYALDGDKLDLTSTYSTYHLVKQ